MAADLGDHRHQALVVELDRGEKGGMGQRVGHFVSFRRAKPLLQIGDQIVRILQPGMDAQHRPLAAKGAAVRWIWLGRIRLSNPPQE